MPVYQFKELSESAKHHVLGWYRENLWDWQWWDDVVEDWVEKLKDLGINTDAKQIEFSGFSSQGDEKKAAERIKRTTDEMKQV